MASRFWVGGSGTWDSSTTTHWSATTNGAGGASVPVAGDNVTFDFNSDLVAGAHTTCTVTVNTTVNVATLTMSTFGATGGAVPVTAGVGILDFSVNNNSVTLTGTFAFANTGTGTRTLNMGNGTWTITGTGTVWNMSVVTNLTFNANSSSMVFTSSSLTQRNFNGGAVTYNIITVSANTGGGTFLFNAVTTATTLNINGKNSVQFAGFTTFTFTNFNVNGTSAGQPFIAGNNDGSSSTVTVASGTQTLAWAGIRDMTFSGGATFRASNSFDLGNNTGITIFPPINPPQPALGIGI